MKLFNTLTGKKEEFIPVSGQKVGMYTCGPTVYDVAHIGNLRKYTCDDLLFRTLKFNDYEIKRVMNITDVDDKTIKKAEGDRKRFDDLTRQYEEGFFADLKELNILIPDTITRATEYIEKIVEFIEDLLKKGYAYKASDGSIYFSISKFKSYGQLSKLENREILVGARINQDEYDKENPSDFALWKAWDASDGEIYWNTSLGKGRPGWHIECSAMSMDTLGETIDIHTGGVDNIFPHHENEIAQSEARSGKKFVNFWVHNEHLSVDGKKMSKSLGNVYNLKDIKAKGFDPLDFRYLMIGAHYRSKINFTWAGLEAARNARERLMRLVGEMSTEGGEIEQNYLQRFREKISDDINAPEALSILWELVRDSQVKGPDKRATILKFDEGLGLGLSINIEIKQRAIKDIEMPSNKVITTVGLDEGLGLEQVIELTRKREWAKYDKDFKQADLLRDEIQSIGYKIEDTAFGPKISRM